MEIMENKGVHIYVIFPYINVSFYLDGLKKKGSHITGTDGVKN